LQWKPISKSCLSTDANYVIPGPFVLSPFISLRKSRMRSPFPSSCNPITSFLNFRYNSRTRSQKLSSLQHHHRSAQSTTQLRALLSTAYLKIRVSHFSFWRSLLHSHPLHLCSSKSAHQQIGEFLLAITTRAGASQTTALDARGQYLQGLTWLPLGVGFQLVA
jgi:hypothetical protein